MNFCFCLDNPFSTYYGGIASVSLTVAQGLRERGYNCFFVSAFADKKVITEGQFYLPEGSVSINNTVNKVWFQNFLMKEKIDVVINQNGTSPYSLWAIKWSKSVNVKVITVYHSSLFGMYSFQKLRNNNNFFVKILKLKPVFDYLYRCMFRVKYGKYYKQQVENSWKLIMLSEKFFPELDWYSGLHFHEKYIAIPNVVNIRRNEHSLINKQKEVLFVGRLSPEKQPDILLKIWECCFEKHREWHLTFVGDGCMREDLRKYVENRNIPRVNFLGYQSPVKYYERASILCMTSYFEGFGLVLVEAMNYGVVPIAFNSYKNVCEIINESTSGYLIRPFSIQEYAEKLDYLMNHPDVRVEMANNALLKSSEFSFDQIIPKWERCLLSDS